MSAPPFRLLYTAEAEKILLELRDKAHYARKYKKIQKTLRQLKEMGPQYPGLNSHPMQSVPGPDGETLWQSYVENRTPGAWRIWWIYGPTQDEITIITLGPHPD